MEIKVELKVGYLCFKNFTPLDLAGPFEILSRAYPDSFIIGESLEPIVSSKGLKVLPDYDLTNAPDFDILVVPGGSGQTAAMQNKELISFIQDRHKKGILTVGVCTGTLLLAKAGILGHKEATTHWLARHELANYGVAYVNKRVVWGDDKIVTGAGVSSGLDLALVIIGKLSGEEKAKEIQLAIEYDPAPPFNSGSPEKSSHDMVQKLISESRFKDSWKGMNLD